MANWIVKVRQRTRVNDARNNFDESHSESHASRRQKKNVEKETEVKRKKEGARAPWKKVRRKNTQTCLESHYSKCFLGVGVERYCACAIRKAYPMATASMHFASHPMATLPTVVFFVSIIIFPPDSRISAVLCHICSVRK